MEWTVDLGALGRLAFPGGLAVCFDRAFDWWGSANVVAGGDAWMSRVAAEAAVMAAIADAEGASRVAWALAS